MLMIRHNLFAMTTPCAPTDSLGDHRTAGLHHGTIPTNTTHLGVGQ